MIRRTQHKWYILCGGCLIGLADFKGHSFLLKHKFDATWLSEFGKQCLKAGDFLCGWHLHIISFCQCMCYAGKRGREPNFDEVSFSSLAVTKLQGVSTLFLSYCKYLILKLPLILLCWTPPENPLPRFSSILRNVKVLLPAVLADTKKLIKTSGCIGKACVDQWWKLLCWQCSRCWLIRLFLYL